MEEHRVGWAYSVCFVGNSENGGGACTLQTRGYLVAGPTELYFHDCLGFACVEVERNYLKDKCFKCTGITTRPIVLMTLIGTITLPLNLRPGGGR